MFGFTALHPPHFRYTVSWSGWTEPRAHVAAAAAPELELTCLIGTSFINGDWMGKDDIGNLSLVNLRA